MAATLAGSVTSTATAVAPSSLATRSDRAWSPRAQAEKKIYGRWVKAALDAERYLEAL